MRVHAEGVADDVKRAMAEFISGRKLAPLAAGDARNMPNRCTSRVLMRDIAAGPVWNGWSPDATNARFHRASGLSASEAFRLTLKWAFGFPGVSSCTASPLWQADACSSVWIPGTSMRSTQVDACTGPSWPKPACNAISIGPVTAPVRLMPLTSATSAATYLGRCQHGRAALEGERRPHPSRRSLVRRRVCEGRLYVPVSSREEAAGGSLNYPCCTFRGSIVALDAATGRQLWKTYAIADPPNHRDAIHRGRSSGPAQGRPSGTLRRSIHVTVPSTLLLATPIPNRRQRPPTP